MTFKRLLLLTCAFCFSILLAVNLDRQENATSSIPKPAPSPTIENGELSGPEQFQLFHNGIRTNEGALEPGYVAGYQLRELKKSKQLAVARNSQARISSSVLEWKERGPANVPGRTRGLAVVPTDPNKNTWFAGASGGGIWKTTDGGVSWINKSPDFPTLAVATLALCTNSPNIIYAGTGEYIASAGTAINGNGIFKSTNGGETWSQLPSTANNSDFISITRVIVDPNNPDLVLACSAPNTWGQFKSTIMRSTNGGTSWTKVYEVASGGTIEQLIATPGNFNIQYAAQNGVGVLKSIDAGQTWALSNTGMSIAGRLELAVSPVNTNRIFASAVGSVSGTGSDLYVSNNGGVNWSLINVSFNNAKVDFLGGQGWYDNTIACDPFNADVVYFGGVGLFKVQLTSGSTPINSYTAEEIGTNFMTLINFDGNAYGGRIRTGSAANASVEIRFGTGQSQKAHRFLVPEGATSGVPDGSFSFASYVDVPFEAWEVDENGNDVRQLMVSFRDQDRNGVFNLLLNNTSGTAIEQSREYVYINNADYSENANSNIAVQGGHAFNQMYFFWPVLSPGNTWIPNSLPTSELRILLTSIPALGASTTTVADVYGQYDGKNRFITFGVDLHPDQHNLIMIPMTGSTYKILASNDGGMFISNTSTSPGVNEDDWTMVGKTYNTSQFYGADKRPGFDEYFGGMQDNGTWKSPAGVQAGASTNYIFNIGGDGFEVLWNNFDDTRLIGGSQGNGFRRSVDGGVSWLNGTVGLTGTHPFISKLANNKYNPDVIFTVSSAGVFRSDNFGASWTLTPITTKWAASTFLDVEVSKANANIIWAGSGMTDSRNLHVSTNGGQSFSVTNNFTDVTLGSITRLASHPYEPNTAYALFSFAGKPKILKTMDLGQTWQDISGFGTNNTSSNGFPDVAVYCLYVRPDDPQIIWAGTEIGIVESQDNGATWTLLNDFINASVWDMKGQDDQVVIATHGRGIWTATIGASQSKYMPLPEVRVMGTSPKKELKLRLVSGADYDSVEVYVSNQYAGTLRNVTSSQFDVAISGVPAGTQTVKLVSYIGNAPFHDSPVTVDHLNVLSVENSYSTYFATLNDLKINSLVSRNFDGAPSGERKTLHTPHPYAPNTIYSTTLLRAIKLNADPIMYVSDVAITQPGNDTIVIEATKNGLDWVTLANYDASANPAWQAAYTNNQPGTKAMFGNREIDLSSAFTAGDSILVRISLHSDAVNTAWGWALNYITIQQEPTGLENPSKLNESVSLFPNPTTGIVNLEFELQHPSEVVAEVIDLFGRKVDERTLGKFEAGKHQRSWETQAPNGSYLVILRTNQGNKTGKILVRR